MKTRKMNLSALKVESFITDMEADQSQETIKGGTKLAVIKTINDAYCRDTGPAKCLVYTGHIICNDTCP